MVPQTRMKRKQSPTLPPTVSVSKRARHDIYFVLCGDSSVNDNKYAFAGCPETYENAIGIAVETLGRYMSNPSPETIVLRVSHETKSGQMVWADIRPQDWQTVSQLCQEIGVFRVERLRDLRQVVGSASKREISDGLGNTVPAIDVDTTADSQPEAPVVRMFMMNGPISRRALIPVPKTYEAAQVAVFNQFKQYLPAGTPPAHLSLRPATSENSEDCAEVSSENWKIIFPLSKLIVILNEGGPEGLGRLFAIQARYPSCNGIQWRPICLHPMPLAGLEKTDLIQQPSTYQHAVASILTIIDNNPIRKQTLLKELYKTKDQDMKHALDKPFQLAEPLKIKFYTFSGPTVKNLVNRDPMCGNWFDLNATDEAFKIPENAYDNQSEWKKYMPPAGHVIGYSFSA
ncbi:hypothetical protein FA15DRAFT_697608 [Coprinopsis marcescibilis]|uniref:Uncharacterized protein n=1 Tax=Coprinopsis marcescibilis TaxID=230819 RepID=A0A5C3KHH9_COPMA|nr:hypothetical protein FA15DRAFT_697608 [Coprinopsis marcescibilis]